MCKRPKWTKGEKHQVVGQRSLVGTGKCNGRENNMPNKNFKYEQEMLSFKKRISALTTEQKIYRSVSDRKAWTQSHCIRRAVTAKIRVFKNTSIYVLCLQNWYWLHYQFSLKHNGRMFCLYCHVSVIEYPYGLYVADLTKSWITECSIKHLVDQIQIKDM